MKTQLFAVIFSAGCSLADNTDLESLDARAALQAPTCETSTRPCSACVHQGRLAGATDNSTCRYLGIPYGKSTAGPNRFMPPEPASKWSGVRQATERGPACPQVPDTSFASSTSEDCLYLNVFAPREPPPEPLPVMVFIHGGSYVSGSADLYSGAGLANAANVVVVTMNYRLGALGFFAHPELDRDRPGALSGLEGIRDQQLALRWVHDNVAAFGGDPNNVTLFGESAGGAAVNLHLVSPASHGLAQRFILESGTSMRRPAKPMAPVGRDAAYTLTQRMAADLCPGAANVLHCLRGLPPERLLEWSPPNGAELGELGAIFLPVIDDGRSGIVPDEPERLMAAGSVNPGAIVLGSNKYEYALFQWLNDDNVASLAELRAKIAARFGTQADEILKLYITGAFTDDPNRAYSTFMTDILFRCATRRLARLAASAGAAVYLYSFDEGEARHTEELVYVLGPNDYADGLLSVVSFIYPRSLVETVQQYWGNHAYGGDPNGPGLLRWPRYEAVTDQHMVLADPPALGAGLARSACDYWDRYLD